ncbi:hypothetical protein K437DRAFT_153762 [Tilletiaria anomala UBC 951]|uniref:Uncharacterized protein n=1 Tax=Tilletiaria anomala (strain ATCC 24038 / CBS 436.72 / UBC 951) TaxID=1037660 RepID=A0A066VWJ2_TILAU|nr:uncharacterized protein K437DRAFT_153762 [Tilletiaria anomala UBC 951]KDN43184.1 hypothetical protein K437DRAFT_153762 [Tilletiaria anomala UBC 951]
MMMIPRMCKLLMPELVALSFWVTSIGLHFCLRATLARANTHHLNSNHRVFQRPGSVYKNASRLPQCSPQAALHHLHLRSTRRPFAPPAFLVP